MFSVFRGASFLITDTVACHFHRPNDTDAASPIWAPVANAWNSPYVLNGKTWVNGTQVDGSSSPMPTTANNGFNQITVATTGATQADGFNRDRIYHAGNQDQAEVILYDTTLSEIQRLGNERYLRTKWFGEAPVSSILPSGTALSVENAAILDLNGATPIRRLAGHRARRHASTSTAAISPSPATAAAPLFRVPSQEPAPSPTPARSASPATRCSTSPAPSPTPACSTS